MIDATIVFEKNWNAIHEKCPNNCGNIINSLDTPIDEDCQHCFGSGRRYKYIINKGSSRSSKTISLIDLNDLLCRSLPNKRITIWRDTKKSCKDTVLSDMIKRFRATGRMNKGHLFNKTESYFAYNNGSNLEIHGADDEEKVHGLTQDAAWLNEPYKITYETFNQIDQRTSDIVFIDYNPKKWHWVEDVMTRKNAIVIHSTFKDNPFCPAGQRSKILSYQPIQYSEVVIDKLIDHTEAIKYDTIKNDLSFSKKQLEEIDRCKMNHETRSANELSWVVYGLGEKGERPNRIFSWDKISTREFIELDAPELYVVDWGKVDPWGIVHLKYYDGAIYAHELNYASEDEVRKSMTPQERADIDNEEEGIVTWMFNKLAIPLNVPVICDNNRIVKIAMLRRKGYLAEPAAKGKGSIMDGIDILQNLRVYFTEDSLNIEQEQEDYSFEADRYGVITDKPEDSNNHTIDPIRYGAGYWQSVDLIKKM